MAYEFIDHTADVMFQATASTIPELFLDCATALNESIHGEVNILEQKEQKLKLEADSLEELLYKFLEEFIFLLDSEDLIFNKVSELKIDENSFILTATLLGDHAKNYHFTSDVKAVTFSNLKISEDNGEFKTKVTLDV
ncbi:archease [archaeon]|jgi:SHS2 domain-containing protein|nr:archease [archaeon]